MITGKCQHVQKSRQNSNLVKSVIAVIITVIAIAIVKSTTQQIITSINTPPTIMTLIGTL